MIDKMIPLIYGNPMEIEYSHPPTGGPTILPKESTDESTPEILPCPAEDIFVNKEVILGRMRQFPIPKMVMKMDAVTKSLNSKIRPNPMADKIIPN